MRWSQLKRRIEANFADSVRGRVEVFVTRYHRAHDGAGEAWVTIDGERVACMSEIAYWKQRLPTERRWLEAWPGHRVAQAVAQELRSREVYSDEDFKPAMFAYLDLSIDDILRHEDPILRAFG